MEIIGSLTSLYLILLAVAVAATVLAMTTYLSSNKAISLVLIVLSIYGIITLMVVDTATSIQLHILVSLGPNPSDPEPDPLPLVIITMLKVKQKRINTN